MVFSVFQNSMTLKHSFSPRSLSLFPSLALWGARLPGTAGNPACVCLLAGNALESLEAKGTNTLTLCRWVKIHLSYFQVINMSQCCISTDVDHLEMRKFKVSPFLTKTNITLWRGMPLMVLNKYHTFGWGEFFGTSQPHHRNFLCYIEMLTLKSDWGHGSSLRISNVWGSLAKIEGKGESKRKQDIYVLVQRQKEHRTRKQDIYILSGTCSAPERT